MKKTEILTLLEKILVFYPNYKISDVVEQTEAWYPFLHDADHDLVFKNLVEHIKSEKFPPTISDLIKQPQKEDRGRYIPSVEETRILLHKQESRAKLGLDTEKKVSAAAKVARAETRRLLGITGGTPHG